MSCDTEDDGFLLELMGNLDQVDSAPPPRAPPPSLAPIRVELDSNRLVRRFPLPATSYSTKKSIIGITKHATDTVCEWREKSLTKAFGFEISDRKLPLEAVQDQVFYRRNAVNMQNLVSMVKCKAKTIPACGELGWVTVAVLANRGEAKSGGKSMFKSWDLTDFGPFVYKAYLNDEAYRIHGDLFEGAIVALVNPQVNLNGDSFTLRLTRADQVVVLGRSTELGKCKMLTGFGNYCNRVVNLTTSSMCIEHSKGIASKVLSTRMDLVSAGVSNIHDVVHDGTRFKKPESKGDHKPKKHRPLAPRKDAEITSKNFIENRVVKRQMLGERSNGQLAMAKLLNIDVTQDNTSMRVAPALSENYSRVLASAEAAAKPQGPHGSRKATLEEKRAILEFNKSHLKNKGGHGVDIMKSLVKEVEGSIERRVGFATVSSGEHSRLLCAGPVASKYPRQGGALRDQDDNLVSLLSGEDKKKYDIFMRSEEAKKERAKLHAEEDEHWSHAWI